MDISSYLCILDTLTHCVEQEANPMFISLFYKTDIGEPLRFQGLFKSDPGEGLSPTIENRRRTSSPFPLLDNLGWPEPHTSS